MQLAAKWIGAGLLFVAAAAPSFATTKEDFRNEKVIVTEEALAPGEQETVAGEHASVVVFLSGDAVQGKYVDGRQRQDAVLRGEVLNEAAGRRIVTNVGHTALRLVRVEFLTAGGDDTWGMTGLPPNYKVFFEDLHSRTYEIRIAPHAWEPQHTHHARVVVCLNGAQLEHVLPDGSIQPSTLKTDEVTWREGQTHKGHNLGDTDLWVIAIEPK
jgi:hypothetical protein